MFHPRNLILGIFLVVFVTTGYASSEDGIIENFEKFFEKWDPHKEPLIRNDLLVTLPRNDTELHRNKRAASQLYPVNLNSGATFCWIPGYTGAHCEFPICEQLNRHNHGEAFPTPVTINYNYRPNTTIPTWFNVDSTISLLIIKLHSDGQNDPRAQTFYEDGTEIGNWNDASSSNGVETIYQYSVLGKPGVYWVQPFSASNNATALQTFISGISDTDLDIEIGFVTNYGTNQPERSDFPTEYAYQNTLNVVVADVKHLDIPGTLSTVTIYSQYSELTLPSPLRVRYGCSYKYYFDSFYCRSIGQYYARFEGYDFYGFSFTRWGSFNCLPALEPSSTPTLPPTPSPTSPTSCRNNGVLITRNDSSAYCYCQGLWTGNQCEVPLCANGGTMMPNNTCLCSGGWSGVHCDFLYCEDIAEISDLRLPPMIVFVIRLRASIAPIISQIRDQILKLQTNYNFNPEYFTQFAVATFNNDQFISLNSYTSVDQLILFLNMTSGNSDLSGGCRDSVYGALWQAVNGLQISKKSPIYVITDAIPDDHQTYQESIYQKNAYWNAPINFIYVDTHPVTCPLDKYDPAYLAMWRMAERSAGLVNYIPQSGNNNTGDLFYSLVWNTYYKGHLIYIDDEKTCSNQPLYETISIDSNDKFWKITFIVVGLNISINLVNPDQIVQTNMTLLLDYQLGDTWVYRLNGLETGTWTFSVISGTANSGCAFRVWALEIPENTNGYTDYNIAWGATPAIVFDAPYREPVWQQPLHIVARITNYPNSTRPIVLYPEFVSAELTIHAQTDNGRQLVLASNGIWRSGCSMQLYFPITNTFTCQVPDQLLYLTIYVRDPLGYMIQRAGVFYCNYVVATIAPSPSPGTCENSGIFYNNTCVCPPDWTGDFCQTPMCYNGGTLFGNIYCQCPPGIGGPNCQFIQCLQANPSPGFNIHRRSLAFLLDITRYNAGTLSLLARTIQQTISDIRSQHAEWIENYYVYVFNSTGVTMLVSAQPYDEAHIVNAFGQAAMLASGGDAACTVQTYQAIIEVSKFLVRNSYIYLYQAATPDNSNFDVIFNASYTIDQARHMLMVHAAQDDANFFGPCNGSLFEYEVLAELAELSQGRFMNLRSSSMPDTLKLLPTMYSSGVVYRRYFSDCSSAQTVFAPVDSYAQSMQVVIRGLGNIQYTINQPNGQAYSNNLIGTYLNDQLNGWTVLDIRKDCDPTWENNNNVNLPYCYQIGSGQNWTSARDICYMAGAYLADDSTIDADTFLSTWAGNTADYWIGLNDVNQTGYYFWDRGPFLPPATFNGSQYSNWDNGQPVNDTVKKCVYRKGKWTVDDCSVSRFFVCQKHKYSASFQPNNLDDYDLPSGRWSVNVNGGNGSCSVEVKVQSSMQIFTGYTNDIHSDFPTVSPYSNSNDNRIVSYVPGFDPQATNNVPFLTNAQIYDLRNATLYAAATYEYRTQCQYQFLSQNFTCPNGFRAGSFFNVLHTGKDARGVPFQRMTSGRCAQQRVCLNQGILYNGQCVCTEYFTGENCTTPICVNGGYLDPSQKTCICMPGYTGPACQRQTCVNPSNTSFYYNNKTFTLIIEKTQKNQAAITSLQASLGDIVLSFGSSWFTSWVVVAFDSTGVTYSRAATNQLDFENNVNAAVAGITDPGNCLLPIFTALLNATQVITPAIGSLQYLVTTGAPSDNDISTMTLNYFSALSSNQLKLYYILTKTSGTGACSQDPNEAHINNLVDFAYGSDGDFVIIDQVDVGPHAKAYLPTLANAALIGNPTFGFDRNSTCQNLVYYFEVDRHSTQIFFSTLLPSLAPKPTVIDPFGNPLSVDEMYPNPNAHLLYNATPNGEGIYTVSLNDNTGPCLLQVRLQGALRYTLGYIVAPAQMPNISWQLDNATNVPMGDQNVIVAHIESDEVRLTYAEIYNPWAGVRTVVSFYARDPTACSYQWVSDVFDCQSKALLIHIYGFDIHAQPFRRSSYTYCAAYVFTNTSTTTGGVTQTQPVTQTTVTAGTPPVTVSGATAAATTTQPAVATTTQSAVTVTAATQLTTTTTKFFTLNVDIVFLLDISSAVNQADYNDMTAFFLNALGTFNIATGPNNPNGTHFAIIQVPGNNWGFIPGIAATFDTITSYNQLKTAFANAFPDPNLDPAQGDGQNLLQNATALTIDPNLLNSGYRTNINNHLVIYVTTSSTPDAAAITTATSILTSGTYSFLALGYKAGGNLQALGSYVGGAGCVYSANDNVTLNGLADKLANQIFDASGSNGKYTC